MPGAEAFEGEVTLRLAGADLVRVEAVGLSEAAPDARPETASPWRTLHYGAGPAALRLRGRIG